MKMHPSNEWPHTTPERTGGTKTADRTGINIQAGNATLISYSA